MKHNDFVKAIEQGISKNKWKYLQNWILKWCSYTYNYGAFPEDGAFDNDVLAYIIICLTRNDFLYANGSHYVISIIEYDWSIITIGQRNKVFAELVDAYSKIQDELSQFLIIEILGDYYADINSLEAMISIGDNSDERRRSLIPMGLAQLIKRNRDNPTILNRAIGRLLLMRNDASVMVKTEAIRYADELFKYLPIQNYVQ